MNTWRLRDAAGEGVRTWAHGRWTSVALTVLVAAAVAAPAVMDVLSIQRVVDAEARWIAQGGRTVVITSNQDGIDADSCSALGGASGVAAAVPVTRLAEAVALSTAPDASIPLVVAGEGLADLLGVELNDGAVLAPAIAAQLGVGPGDHLLLRPAHATGVVEHGAGPPVSANVDQLTTGTVTIAAVADLTLLGESNATGIVLPAGSGVAASCFVTLDPGADIAGRESLAAALTRGSTTPVVADRLTSGEFVRSFSAEHSERDLRAVPWAAGAVVGSVWLMIRWLRRGQDGLYATLGADWSIRAVIRLSEWAALTAVSTVLAGTVIMAFLVPADVSAVVAVPFVLRSSLMTLATASSLAALGTLVPLRSPLSSLKDR